MVVFISLRDHFVVSANVKSRSPLCFCTLRGDGIVPWLGGSVSLPAFLRDARLQHQDGRFLVLS